MFVSIHYHVLLLFIFIIVENRTSSIHFFYPFLNQCTSLKTILIHISLLSGKKIDLMARCHRQRQPPAYGLRDKIPYPGASNENGGLFPLLECQALISVGQPKCHTKEAVLHIPPSDKPRWQKHQNNTSSNEQSVLASWFGRRQARRNPGPNPCGT